mgnify:CR=1 FL=1
MKELTMKLGGIMPLDKELEMGEQEWYESLVSECKAIITEAVFTSRWALVEGYWELGKRIREEHVNFERVHVYGEKIVQGLAQSLDMSSRTIHYALKAYDKFPSLDKIPEGKNITWNKLITQYLPAPKENILEKEIPKGMYELIVCDPPWKYGTEYSKENRRAASPYKELSQEELKKLQIPSANDSVLWLWTTHKFIWDAKELLDHWGFEYKAILTWNKEKMGMGVWLRMQTEFCLLGIKGKPKWNLKNERDMLNEQRREHSRKPECFYEMAERLTPTEHKIDVFGREQRNGWIIYGNEEF